MRMKWLVLKMGKYYEEYAGVVRDELIGDAAYPVKLRNVTLSSGTAVTRGTILAAATVDGVYAPATSADVNKNLAIAVSDFTASSDGTVTQAYSSGVFNREKLTPSDTSVFELELRRQNIHLTSIKKNYDG